MNKLLKLRRKRESSIGLSSVLLSVALIVSLAVAVFAADSDNFKSGQASLSALAARLGFLTEYINFPSTDFGRFSIQNDFSNADSDSSANRANDKFAFSDDSDNVVFDEFDGWVKNFIERGGQATDKQAAAGEQLALLRRATLKQLIANNPQTALERAMTAELIAQLPDYITDNSERRISGTGDFLVYTLDEFAGTDSKSGRGTKRAILSDAGWRTERAVELDGIRYRASVYGRRTSMTTKMAIPMQGIAIDSEMAVDESPAQKIDKTRSKAEIGGRTRYFADEKSMAEYIDEQIKWESVIGPTRPTATETSGKSPEATADSWTEGAKTIQVIRVDFSDRPGDPVGNDGQIFTLERAQSVYALVNQFFFNNSYGKTSVTATVTPTVVRMPQTLAYYEENYNSSTIVNVMSADARAAAQAKGYSGSYDFDVVAFSNARFPFRGLSNTGAKGSLLSGALSFREVAHELGHNFGLEHANLWQTTNNTIIGTGSDVEYGDCFDMMADCSKLDINSHFNVAYKKLLNWLTDANVEQITSTRNSISLFAQDYSSSPGGTRALKIARDGTRNYWIEFRQSMSGVLIRWDLAERNFKQTQLLDMTPSSTPSPNDAALLVGQNFYDVEKGIRITVLRKDATTPESIVLKVEVGLPPPDCTYSLSSNSYSGSAFTEVINTDVITRSDCPWTATSNDPGWITVTGGNSGLGNGTVSITTLPNPGPARTGTVTIAGKPFTITQVAGNCLDTIKALTTDFSSSGGNLTLIHSCNGITALIDGTSDWIAISDEQTITILPNSGIARTGTLKLKVADINGTFPVISIKVNQAGQGTTNCTFALSATGKDFDASGGADIFSLNPTTAGCSSTYTAVSNSSWITVINPSGDTGRNISYSVAANSGSSRSGTITVTNPITGNQTFIINQAVNKSRKRVRFFN